MVYITNFIGFVGVGCSLKWHFFRKTPWINPRGTTGGRAPPVEFVGDNKPY